SRRRHERGIHAYLEKVRRTFFRPSHPCPVSRIGNMDDRLGVRTHFEEQTRISRKGIERRLCFQLPFSRRRRETSDQHSAKKSLSSILKPIISHLASRVLCKN